MILKFILIIHILKASSNDLTNTSTSNDNLTSLPAFVEMPQSDLQQAAGNDNMASAVPAVQTATNTVHSTGESGDLLTRLQENLPSGYEFRSK